MIIIIKMFLICWFITEYSPLQDLIENFVRKQRTCHNGWKNMIFDNLYILLSCKKCLGFTLTLLVTMDIFTSIIVSILGQVYDLKIKN